MQTDRQHIEAGGASSGSKTDSGGPRVRINVHGNSSSVLLQTGGPALVECVAGTAAVSSPSPPNHVDGILRAHPPDHRIVLRLNIRHPSLLRRLEPRSMREHPRLSHQSGVKEMLRCSQTPQPVLPFQLIGR
ncbi:hypothetical protein EYF80_015072 [Liparis tanakae]|uniref:Uncharacterized protein n=1 Tax=Liparis tanakae TaxID=230148 RepID=A0A4Z2IBM8_9TELE|nr:hypothetical protein EYF80_015072 [Liparis tanakae]